MTCKFTLQFSSSNATKPRDGRKTTEGGKIPRHPFIHSVERKNRTGQEFLHWRHPYCVSQSICCRLPQPCGRFCRPGRPTSPGGAVPELPSTPNVRCRGSRIGIATFFSFRTGSSFNARLYLEVVERPSYVRYVYSPKNCGAESLGACVYSRTLYTFIPLRRAQKWEI